MLLLHSSVHTVFSTFYKNIMAIKLWKRLCTASHLINLIFLKTLWHSKIIQNYSTQCIQQALGNTSEFNHYPVLHRITATVHAVQLDWNKNKTKAGGCRYAAARGVIMSLLADQHNLDEVLTYVWKCFTYWHKCIMEVSFYFCTQLFTHQPLFLHFRPENYFFNTNIITPKNNPVICSGVWDLNKPCCQTICYHPELKPNHEHHGNERFKIPSSRVIKIKQLSFS